MSSKKANLKIADVAEPLHFKWTEQNSAAAIGLAEGKTQQEVADELEISRQTVWRWTCNDEFAAEVDRLSVMVGVAARAERLRIAQRVVRTKIQDGVPKSDKDLLEWLKYAQTETDGVKLDLAAFAAAFGQDETSVADSRQAGSGQQKKSNTGR